MSEGARHQASLARWPDYRAVWRWHFYAGLFCIPFVLVLATTGTIYLFKPQIEDWLDRPYDQLMLSGPPASADQHIQAALTAFPEAAFEAYELPPGEAAAVRILVREQAASRRVYIHPQSCEVLHSVLEEERLIRVVRRIHGTLLIGERGSYLVELAACWTIVMILTGLYLWWPRNARGWGGVLYPRWLMGNRILLRDLHSVTGIWISFLAMFLILTGLPWANLWGNYFRSLRGLATRAVVISQDWSLGGAPEPTAGSADHSMHNGGGRSSGRGGRRRGAAVSLTQEQLADAVTVVAAAQELSLDAPVQISSSPTDPKLWTIQSLTQNRPRRSEVTFNATSREVVARKDFADRPMVDRIVSVGIAAHEGQLFGWPNQLLGVMATSGLLMLSVSGLLLWWKRRQPGALGAPPPALEPRWAWGLISLIVLLGLYLPMFGLSLLAVLLSEKFLLSRIPTVSHWLGLRVGHRDHGEHRENQNR